MHIQEAVKSAAESGQCVTRKAWGGAYRFRVEPTNTPDCCVAHSGAMKSPRRGWQPKAEDLIADDWLVVD